MGFSFIPFGWFAKTPVLFMVSLLLLVSLACGLSGASVDSGQNQITVVNEASEPLCSIRIKKASSQTFWGANRLPSGQSIAPGDSFVIANLADGRYDLDAALCDNQTHPGFGRYSLAVANSSETMWVVGRTP
jgi:hypothetical protein